ncbi:MAG: ABC transporter substrate-binding protein [Actinomycetota bacterium]|nr:ABC transporter substrate-binding protein [Actinomycetota bacterium]
MRTLTRLGALLVATMLLAAPAVAQSPSEGGDDKLVFRIGLVNDIDSLNPFKALELPSYEIISLQYNLLIEFSQEDLSPVPGLAESWETSEDGLTWTYHLNPDATFHDGEPVTSDDVRFTLETILDNPGPAGLFSDYVSQIDTIETPDEHTVVMTTKKPSVQMLSMYVPILPEHVWSDVPADELKAFPNEPSIGTGPFQAVEWDRGQSVKLVKNENYFGDVPEIDEIYFQLYDNDDTMVQALKRGEVDYIYNPSADLFLSLEGEPGIETLSSADPGYTELALNVYEPAPEAIELGAPEESKGHPALLDVRVRQAINWAVDEEELTDKILRGQGTPGSVIVPPTLAQYHLELEEDELMGFDIERAQELLAEAGWEDTNDNGTVDKNGEELELRLAARSEDSSSVRAAEFIEGWLNETGIGVDTVALTDNKLIEDIYATDFDMFIWGWGSDPDPDFILSVMTCGQINNFSDSFWCNEEYDRLYELQKTQLDVEQRAETIHQMQRIAYEESPYVVLYYDNLLEAYRTDKWEGWVQQPADAGSVMFSYGAYSYTNLRPASAEGDAAGGSDGGSSPALWIIIGLAALVVVGIGIALARRGGREDRA